MSETGSIYIGKLRVFGTDRSGKADVFENGEKVGQITEKDLREAIGESDHELTATLDLDAEPALEAIDELQTELESLNVNVEVRNPNATVEPWGEPDD